MPALTTAELHRRVGIWLLVSAGLIYSVVVVGGITRLTRSGLSIVDWDPVAGTFPPMSEESWQRTFDAYKTSPEFNLVNSGMSLGDFKSIFWWEYSHRLLGRIIGVVLLVPFTYLTIRRRLDRQLTARIVGLIALVGVEGLLGWYMVMSGLVNEPRVSQYRLTAHLMTATAVLGATLWVAWDLFEHRDVDRSEEGRVRLQRGFGVVALVVMMLASGALVAGTRAGEGFNTFPLMDGRLIPDNLLRMSPSWLNFTENLVTVQFQHRLLALVVSIVVPAYALGRSRHAGSRRLVLASYALVASVAAQIALGIATLLNGVPLVLGSLHQAGGLLVFVLTIFVVHQSRYVDSQRAVKPASTGTIVPVM